MDRQEHFLNRLDQLIADQHLLKHPFYQTWVAGELPRTALQGYARQYYKQVEAFPVYLAGVYTRCDNLEDRRLVLRNLIEEDHGPENHPELWLRFAEGIGVRRDDVLQADATPETRSTVETFRRLTLEKPAAEGMAALYAYEAMVPEVAETKIAGLKRHYAIEDARTLEFFVVHEQADREHREWDRAVLKRQIRDEADGNRAVEAGAQALGAMWTLLDGVHQRYVTSPASA